MHLFPLTFPMLSTSSSCSVLCKYFLSQLRCPQLPASWFLEMGWNEQFTFVADSNRLNGRMVHFDDLVIPSQQNASPETWKFQGSMQGVDMIWKGHEGTILYYIHSHLPQNHHFCRWHTPCILVGYIPGGTGSPLALQLRSRPPAAAEIQHSSVCKSRGSPLPKLP